MEFLAFRMHNNVLMPHAQCSAVLAQCGHSDSADYKFVHKWLRVDWFVRAQSETTATNCPIQLNKLCKQMSDFLF